ncbi:hypothetical protein PQX77_014151 [Marasmius sp. AFHP31]|nr:hypothetical protein PQX77_014151 [Marasmius sp. AFHP31]
MNISLATATLPRDAPSQLLVGNDDSENFITSLEFGADSNNPANNGAHSDLPLARATVGAEYQEGGQSSILNDSAVLHISPGPPTWKRAVSGEKIPGGPPTWRRAPVEGESKVESPSDEARYRPKPGPPTWQISEGDLKHPTTAIAEQPTASGSNQYVTPGPPTWKV